MPRFAHRYRNLRQSLKLILASPMLTSRDEFDEVTKGAEKGLE